VIEIVGGLQVLNHLIQQNAQIGRGDKLDNFAVSILTDGASIASKDYKACVDHDLVVQLVECAVALPKASERTLMPSRRQDKHGVRDCLGPDRCVDEVLDEWLMERWKR
jgi:hypothetical protein